MKNSMHADVRNVVWLGGDLQFICSRPLGGMSHTCFAVSKKMGWVRLVSSVLLFFFFLYACTNAWGNILCHYPSIYLSRFWMHFPAFLVDCCLSGRIVDAIQPLLPWSSFFPSSSNN
mmetsp:Transcript_8048/g.15713  ORF Transcript_8048/g.15713 Transcript_8048/m.15713 type:complete len:117 (-) Transcript_8048:840-1190(-)